MYSKFGQFIDGKWQSSEKKETYDVINPATELIGKCKEKSRIKTKLLPLSQEETPLRPLWELPELEA